MQSKLSKIISNVFVASIKNASFELDYNNCFLTQDGGIAIELSGKFDYDTLQNSFNNTYRNIRDLADEFSKELLQHKNDESIPEKLRNWLKGIESISTDKYYIRHDENKNQILLVLPYNALKKQESEEDKENKDKDNINFIRTQIGCIFIAPNIESIFDRSISSEAYQNKTYIKISKNKSKSDSDVLESKEKAGITIEVEYMIGNHDVLICRCYLIIERNDEIIYNKYVDYKINLKEYGIFDINQTSTTITLIFNKNEKEINELFRKAEKEISNIFKKDIEE